MKGTPSRDQFRARVHQWADVKPTVPVKPHYTPWLRLFFHIVHEDKTMDKRMRANASDNDVQYYHWNYSADDESEEKGI